MTDTQKGTVSVSRELLSAVYADLDDYLSRDLCECEYGHICGRTDIEKHRDELRTILAQPTKSPCSACWGTGRLQEPGNPMGDCSACSAQPAEQQDEPVAMVVSKFGDPEAFGEREIEARADLSKVPYNTPLYRRPAAQAVKLPAVEGDELPALGSAVLIHLGSSDTWVPHTVVGYYAWDNHKGDDNLHRVFVRVQDADGYLNARLLKDVRKVDAVAKLNGIEP